MKFSLSDCSPSVCFEDLMHCTFQALARVPDFRKAKGRQLDLSGILALIVVGLASGHHSFAAIAAFLFCGMVTSRAENYSATKRHKTATKEGTGLEINP